MSEASSIRLAAFSIRPAAMNAARVIAARFRDSLFGHILPYINRHGWTFWPAMVTVNSSRLVEAVIPIYLKLGIDRVSVGNRDLTFPVLMILGLMLFRYLLLNTGRRMIRSTAVQVGFELRQTLFWHMGLQSPSFFARFPIGDLMARAINDIALVRQFVGQGTRLTLMLCFSSVVAVVFMWHQSAHLTLLLMPVMPVLALIAWRLARQILERSVKVQAGFSTLSEQVQENLNGIRTIQAHAQEDCEIERFTRAATTYGEQYYGLMAANSLLTALMAVGGGAVMLIVVGFGGSEVLDGRMTVGTFTAFIFYLGMLLTLVKESGNLITLYQRASSASTRIFELLKHPPEIADAPDAVPVEAVTGQLILRDASYGFGAKGGRVVRALGPVSLTVEAGEMVAVMGRVGAGKSTLLRLLVRLLDPPAGSVFLDGRDVRTIPLAALRGQIALVAQDPFLFAAPFTENIAFDDPQRSVEQIWQAAEAAHLHVTIQRLPDGLETVIGERGVTLSGGQKQRTSLARGLIRQTPVLLLDDCFSAVDTETEAAILSRLRRVRQGRTTILVSHRVSTARFADRIIVLADGRIAESGTHAELLALGGTYAELQRLQGRPHEGASHVAAADAAVLGGTA